jgi:hypothetical protein
VFCVSIYLSIYNIDIDIYNIDIDIYIDIDRYL